jgi:hypothetical protein
MPADHHDTDAFRGATFRRADLTGASFREVDLSGATIRDSDVRGLRVVASVVDDVHVSGHEGVGRVVVDDVDVSDHVRAELDRRHPERVLVREMRTADQLREAWAVVDRLWADTEARALGLPEAVVNERVEGEWSFVETVRHLLFADDVWVGRLLLGASTYHPLGVPPTDTTDAGAAEMGLDLAARPTCAEVVALHQQRRQRFTGVLDGLTDDRLGEVLTAVLSPEWGEESFSVRECLTVVVREHCDHRRFAVRDLAVLEAGGSAPA